MHLIHRCQQGFTTVTLMGVLMVGGMLVAASFAVVDPDISLSQKDDDSKQAYAAAEAGVSYYMNRLAQDSTYYTHCANVPSATQNAVNNEWSGTGADPRRFRKIPGYQSDYAVELLAVQTAAVGTELCVENVPGSMIDASTGSFRIRSTGRARTPRNATDFPKKRSIVATLRRKAFLDYLYFTDRETLDPLAYRDTDDQAWAGANCDAPRQDRPDGLHRDQLHHPGRGERPVPLERQHPHLRVAQLRQRRRRHDRAQPGQPGLGLLRRWRHPRLHRHAQVPRRHSADAAVELRARGRRRTPATCSRARRRSCSTGPP